MQPRIHANYVRSTNGTAPDVLAYDIDRARSAVTRAIDAVRTIAPHGRDYVGRDDRLTFADLDAHRAMLRTLEQIEDELHLATMRISDMVE